MRRPCEWLSTGRRLFRLVEASHDVLQLIAQFVHGHDVRQRQPDAREFTGEELRVRLGAGSNRSVVFRLSSVAFLLTVLGEEDQRRGIGGLHGEHQVQQDERVWVPTQCDGGDVDDDPQDHDRGLHDEESCGAEVTGDGLREAAESLGVIVDAEGLCAAGTCEVLTFSHDTTAELG